ncbi:MAG: lysylphosphatidylglycerol synthase transmembrane domain-containing protein [Leptospirales bacterium]
MKLLKILISVLVLVYLFFLISWEQLLLALENSSPGYYVFSAAIAMLGPIVMGLKYYYLLKGTEIQKKAGFMVRVNYISRYYSILLPSGVGQLAVRWYQVTRNETGRLLFFMLSVYERVSFILVVCIIYFATAMVYKNDNRLFFSSDYVLTVVSLVLAFTVAVILYFRLKSFRALVYRPLSKVFSYVPFVHKFFEKVSKNVSEAAEKTMVNNKKNTIESIFSLIWILIFFIRYYFIAQSLHLNISFVDMFLVSMVLIVIQMLPISFSGVGVREGGLILMYQTLGESQEAAVLSGIMFFSHILFIALFGMVFLILGKYVDGNEKSNITE